MLNPRHGILALAGILSGLTLPNTLHAQAPESVTLSDVYSRTLPKDTDPTQTVNGVDQLRSLAINRNRESAWAGTLYVTRREAANPAATPDIFFWRATATNPQATAGSGLLTVTGPDWRHPDGRFDKSGLVDLGYTPTGTNSFWGIGVARDDYVYVTGLTSGRILRYDPDGTDPVMVVSAGFPRTRALYVTGAGMDTRLWAVLDNNAVATSVQRWKPSGTDATGGPINFVQEILFTKTELANQTQQLVVDADRENVFFGLVRSGNINIDTPVKRSAATGDEDTAFTQAMVEQGIKGVSGVTIDSQDRAIYFAMLHQAQDWGIAAVDPATGENLTTNDSASFQFKFFTPPAAALLNQTYTNYVMMARYSDRHHFYLGNVNPTAGAPGTGDNVFGAFATDLPAAAPTNVQVTNTGTGNSLQVSWTLNDPEAIGVDIYRSTNAGTLGTKVNPNTVTTAPYSDNGLSANTTYYYTVRAVATDPFTNQNYFSAGEPQASGATVPVGIPNAPADQQAVDFGDGRGVRLSWTNPTVDVTGIRIYRSTSAGTIGALLTPGPDAPTPGAAQEIVDASVVMGTTYHYTIKAVNGLGQESTNTNQLTVTATDSVAPTFAGIAFLRDYGMPGLRVFWNPAQDHSAPITYNIYTSADGASFNFSSPAASTTTTQGFFDLTDLAMRRDVYVIVRAEDAAGNEEANTVVLGESPRRVIVDSDRNGGINSHLVNPQPDAGVPALVVSPGADKGATPDVVNTSFLPGVFYYNTNDKKGKVEFTVPITRPGRYEVAANWSADPRVNTPGYIYHITFPDGSTEDVTLDQLGSTGRNWNLLATRTLTAGTLKIVGDATQSPDSDPEHWNVSGMVRAFLLPASPAPVYRLPAAPTINGDIAPGEYANVPALHLGEIYQNVGAPATYTGGADYSASVYATWDATALYLAANVTDNVVSFPATAENLIWQRDGLELYIGLANPQDPARTVYDFGTDAQVIFSANDNGGTLSGAWYSPQAFNINDTTAAGNVAVQRTATGYVLEAKIPWASLEVSPPTQDQVIGFNLHANDNDQEVPAEESFFSLSERGGSWTNPSNWLQAILLGTPPAPTPGDVNNDGMVNAMDVRLALRVAGGLLSASDPSVSVTAADVAPPTGVIDLADAVRIADIANP